MAYVDFASEPMLALHTAPRHDPLTSDVPGEVEATGFSALEWSVVALAQRDRLSSLREPGAVSIAMGAVFGTRRRSPRLADPRLEALRRMAVLGWHRGFAVPVREEQAFLEAGYSLGQYETLLTSIGVGRARMGARA